MAETAKHILVVDDEPDLLSLMEQGLKRHGFLVHTTRTAEQAFQKLAQKPYHALITDIHLPGMNGMKLVAHVRKSAQNPGMPVFAITGAADVHDLSSLSTLKVMDVVTKPFDIESLALRVKSAILESQKKKVFSSQVLFETFFQSVAETFDDILCGKTRFHKASSSTRAEIECDVSVTAPFASKNFFGFFSIAMKSQLVDLLEDNVLGAAAMGNFADPAVIGDLAQDIANRALGVAKTRLEKFNITLTCLPISVSVGTHHKSIHRTELPIVSVPLILNDSELGIVNMHITSIHTTTQTTNNN